MIYAEKENPKFKCLPILSLLAQQSHQDKESKLQSANYSTAQKQELPLIYTFGEDDH